MQFGVASLRPEKDSRPRCAEAPIVRQRKFDVQIWTDDRIILGIFDRPSLLCQIPCQSWNLDVTRLRLAISRMAPLPVVAGVMLLVEVRGFMMPWQCPLDDVPNAFVLLETIKRTCPKRLLEAGA